MHETAVTKTIFETVLRSAEQNGAQQVVSVTLEISAFSDLETMWLQRFFSYFAKGTVAEGARLEVTRRPLMLECVCSHRYPVERAELQTACCPMCGQRKARLVSSREYIIRSIDIV